MQNYSNIKYKKNFFYLLLIIFIKGANVKDKRDINIINNFISSENFLNYIPTFKEQYKYYEFDDMINQNIFYNFPNKENYPLDPFPPNQNEPKKLELGKNNITLNEGYNLYFLDLNNISQENKTGTELLIYTNFSEDSIFYLKHDKDNRNDKDNIDNKDNKDNQDNRNIQDNIDNKDNRDKKDKKPNIDINEKQSISNFELFPNKFIMDNGNLSIEINSRHGKYGFIDFSLEKEGKFEINKNITREIFYNRTIILNKTISEKKFFINFVNTDNNSDLYYLQIYPLISKEDKRKFKLFYLKVENNTGIKDLKKKLRKIPLRRDRRINGKIEIFGYKYNNLSKDTKIILRYIRIKGEGKFGFIISISTLFFILIIIVIIYFKNK